MAERFDQLIAKIARIEGSGEDRDVLEALSRGEVDALVFDTGPGKQVYIRRGADEAYRVLVEEMAEGVVTVDNEGIVLSANRAFAAMVGRAKHEVVGSTFASLLRPEAWDQLRVALLAGEFQIVRFETQLKPAGSAPEVPVQISSKVITIEGFTCLGMTVSDLTENRRAQALAQAERFARAVLDGVGEFIIVTDAQGVIVRCNARCEKVMQPLLGGRLDDHLRIELTDTDFRQRLTFAHLHGLHEQGAALSGREALVEFSGSRPFPAIVTSSALAGIEHQGAGTILTIVDMTERHRSDQLRRELLAQLNHSNRQLSEANMQLQTLTYGLSHDLRAALRGIHTRSELIARDPEAKARFGRHLEGIQANTRLISGLLDDVMSTRTGPDSPARVSFEPVSLSEHLDIALGNLETELRQSEAVVERSGLHCHVQADSDLWRVFQNLIENSIKYRGDQPPRIDVSAVQEGAFCRITVTDEGIGIPHGSEEKIFELFHRGNDGPAPGTGIGLATVRSILHRYGGSISALRRPGPGSEFVLLVPQAATAAER